MRKILDMLLFAFIYVECAFSSFTQKAFAFTIDEIIPKDAPGVDIKFEDGISNGLRGAQSLAIAYSIFSGIKVVANWGNGQQNDKDAVVRWAIGFFLILVFL